MNFDGPFTPCGKMQQADSVHDARPETLFGLHCIPHNGVQEVYGLIDQGVQMMRKRQYKQASPLLIRALQKNKDIMMLHGPRTRRIARSEESLSVCCNVLEKSLFESSSTILDHSNDIVKPWLCPNVGQDSQQEKLSLFIHPAPLDVATWMNDLKSDLLNRIDFEDLNITISIIIIFDLALSTHLQAIETIAADSEWKRSFDSEKQILKRALSLYSHVQTLMKQQRISCWLLCAVVANNEAQILSFLGEEDIAEDQFRRVHSGLCYMVSSKQYPQSEWSYSCRATTSVLEGLFHNTSQFVLRAFSAGAA